MGARSLDTIGDFGSHEPIQPTMRRLRPRKDGNPRKFINAQRSLERLRINAESAMMLHEQLASMEIFHRRMEQVLALSTTHLRIAPGTNEWPHRNDYDEQTIVQEYELSRLTTESADVANMTAADVAEARLAYARHRIAERALLAAETHDADADHEVQLARAEEFVASLDERAIIRSLTPEPNGNATRIDHWWNFVGDDQ